MATGSQVGRDTEVVSLLPTDADRLLQLQKDILENIAIGNDHQVVLDELCKTAETMLPRSVASIMLFDSSHEALEVRSAPSIPDYGISQLNGLVPGPAAGSCGTAVYEKEAQYVCNIAVDPRWESLRDLARDFSLHSCWSNPIVSQNGEVIGSFALSSFEQREPSDFHKHLLQAASSLASIVLKRQTEEELLQHAAHYDDLTDLPNRVLFSIRLRHAISKAKRSSGEVAILFIDLDNFKIINDTRGHEQGDKILISVAKRFSEVTREADTLARLGGDEFVLLIEDDCEHEILGYIANKLLACLEEPFQIGKQQYRLSASIGISRYPRDGENKNTLLQHADLAMYEAKAKGRNRFEFYDVALTYLINERVNKEAELLRALDCDEFVIHYQPILNAKTGQVAGVEALVRWQHPEQGLMAPGDFIAVAEESGLIGQLGNLITRKSCAEAKRLIENGDQAIQLSVNLSVKQLDAGLHKDIADILDATAFPAVHLQMEVTESLIMEQGSLAISELLELRESGVQVAMDDFGTGHSSLAQLKSLPMNKLKIDRSFVMGLPQDKDDVIICQTIIAMGHSLGFEVVAEGVETEQQKGFLIENGCDYLQGYLFARPMPIEECARWLESHRTKASVER